MPAAHVQPSDHRLRLDRFLKRRAPEAGRGLILEWVRGGRVSVNGRPVAAAEYYVKRGDRVEWPGRTPPGPGQEPGCEPEWPPAVLREDRDLLVVNKPAHLPTNPSPAAGSRNVLSILERGAGRLYLVHRLDRDTSGALVLARTLLARDRLRAAFRARRIEKLYDAVVAGRMRRERGSLRQRLLPSPRRSSRRVEPAPRGGLGARTDYRVVERFRACTRLEVCPLSGRMHQVRAHLAAAGHFILGDTVYGRPHASRPPRLCLHARRLAFPHPRTGETVAIEAPLPIPLASFLERLRRDEIAPASGRGRSRS